jgi:UDPglucose--hexose-1-phosphate uridylyltransferase
MERAAVKKTVITLADGRELVYYDAGDGAGESRAEHPDRRPLEPMHRAAETRFDEVQGEWVAIAAHRQNRTYHPPADQCPLCPSTGDRLSEIPAPGYEVAVFENRFPSLGGPDGGRCEVVCFTSEHDKSFADLDEERVALVLEAWADRTAELLARPDVRQVYCFENRGEEIGVTLAHPHGQIYAFPYLAPKMDRELARAAAHRARTGRNLFEDLVAREAADERVIEENEHWIAFTPYAARWPYEAHLYPKVRTPDFTALDDAQRASFPSIYLSLLRRFDGLFPAPEGASRNRTPYIAAWHQAPKRAPGAGTEMALHAEIFTVRRAPGKLKFLAGAESGMGAFASDTTPESAAIALRKAGR